MFLKGHVRATQTGGWIRPAFSVMSYRICLPLECAMSASYVDPRNGKLYPLHEPRWCSDERTPLLVTPGAGISRDDIDGRTRSLWRYRAALPVQIAKPITLGEGCTPLVQQG